ncbi:unnamed protein product [Rhizophagus irregularis]|uniref:Uncharacterized protein n=1 Tax=Rhizophagus irregularis TaxID=588596 RepID=A0A915ZR40_9GLOM|nr:unnamed protein product [Rhizophagus irregularis]CAB5386624.1 unnamed protein product [Rhizophagus irregularis]
MDFQQKKLLLDFTTVYKIRRIYDHWGYVTHPFKGRQGRRKTLNLVDLNILVSLVKDKKDWHLDEMDDEMERKKLQKLQKKGKEVVIKKDFRHLFLHKCYLK